jgi:DNA-binding transcriptional LysR family regulator
MKMELRHLRYFVAVARERSFSRAAEVLHIAQPPLSRQIQQLEEELGVQLIKRGTRPAHLTEQGRLLYEQAVQILERMEEIRAIVRRLERSKRNIFSMGFVASTLYGRLPEVIRAYRAARPDTELNLVELTSLEQLSALKEGRIDVGFGRIPLDDPTVTRQLLRNERLVVAFPLGHPISARPGPLRLEHLADERLIVYPKAPRPSYADQVLALFRDQGLKPAALHEVRELQTALGLVVAEAGICLVPASVEQLRRDRITYKSLDEDAAVSPIFMSCRKDDASPEIVLVLELIRDLYEREGIAFGA